MVAELVFICFPISIFLCCVRDKKNLWKCLFKKIDEIQKRNILFKNLKNLWILNLGNLAPSDTQLQIMPDLDALWYTIVNKISLDMSGKTKTFIFYTCLEPQGIGICSALSQSWKTQKKALPVSNWYSKNKWKKYHLDRSDYLRLSCL